MKHNKYARRLVLVTVSVFMVFVLGITSTFARYYKSNTASASLDVLDYDTSVVSYSNSTESSFSIASTNFYPGLTYQKVFFRVKSTSQVPVGYSVTVTTTGNQPLTIKFLYHNNNSSTDRRQDATCGYLLNAASSADTITKTVTKNYSLDAGTNYQDFDLSISWYDSIVESGQTNNQSWRKDIKYVNEIDYITVSINTWQA